MSRSPEPKTEDEGEWRFGIDDVGPDGIVEDTPAEAEPIEPGKPQAENVVFVLLGVLLAVGLVLVTIFPNAA
ncbi:hypothetical protein GJR96_01310 [Haloferax sp. MBLA0076]|uniref:DUF7312 domain-containing protein n=1 Tax=Haloferax litoreum TaxID=2666140 RepID=A0A6A8GCQ7_9EURY|nr:MULTISPECIES: hypothetical protein [Haloferax]KAB1192151.1 hypothetical protein Hfx1148_01310 [Haloferax sp. CBA1148]MRX20599.1 hypothetical protein [Haloferax litoreum]